MEDALGQPLVGTGASAVPILSLPAGSQGDQFLQVAQDWGSPGHETFTLEVKQSWAN